MIVTVEHVNKDNELQRDSYNVEAGTFEDVQDILREADDSDND